MIFIVIIIIVIICMSGILCWSWCIHSVRICNVISHRFSNETRRKVNQACNSKRPRQQLESIKLATRSDQGSNPPTADHCIDTRVHVRVCVCVCMLACACAGACDRACEWLCVCVLLLLPLHNQSTSTTLRSVRQPGWLLRQP